MKTSKNLADLRREYLQPEFNKSLALKNPVDQFMKWFDEIESMGVEDANAMTLATVGRHGMPSARVVLLKGVDQGNFIFYTNLQSDKGREIAENPKVCLNFYWPQLSRQVKILGVAERVSEETSAAYFQSRPRESQIGAWSSPQSSPIKNREILEERYRQIEEKYKDKKVIDKPKQWGGYSVVPVSFEFWQGRPNRLHDRLLYVQNNEGNWSVQRLAP